MRKMLIIGLGPVFDGNFNPVRVTRKQAEKITAKKQDHQTIGLMFPSVCDCGDYWRGNYGGQPERV